jgi:carboxyl-terminal processing protease
MGKVVAREDATYQHLRVFEDVVSLVVNNYVESVDVERVMDGALRGLAEGLDADSAYLSPEQVTALERDEALPEGETGLNLTRQYYLRVVAVRDGSPAARAGLRTGDYLRAVDRRPTRTLSVFDGTRLLRGPVGSKVALTVIRGSAAEPHEVELTRERLPATAVHGRLVDAVTGYVRIAAFGADAADRMRAEVDALTRGGATRFVIDLRGTADGSVDAAVEAARLFVAKGTLTARELRGGAGAPVTAGAGDGAIAGPVVLLVTAGTAGPAEVFAAALVGNGRAEAVGERTLGRATEQSLVRLPDGSGLWMTVARHVAPGGKAISGNGVEPSVVVEEPDVEFGAAPPAEDVILERALATLDAKKAA